MAYRGTSIYGFTKLFQPFIKWQSSSSSGTLSVGEIACRTVALQASRSLAKFVTWFRSYRSIPRGDSSLFIWLSQVVFLIFRGIRSALALPGSYPVISGGVQANLAFSVGWLRSMGLLRLYCKDPCLICCNVQSGNITLQYGCWPGVCIVPRSHSLGAVNQN